MLYFLADPISFYDDAVHGARQIQIPDPNWKRPTKKIDDPNWKRPIVKTRIGQRTVKEGDEEKVIDVHHDLLDMAAEPPQIEVEDETQHAPLITIDNPKTVIPKNAVEITPEKHKEIFDAHAAGQDIGADENGQPINKPYPPYVPTTEQKIAQLEATITPRRLREHTLGKDGGWLENIDREIEQLRSTLG